MNGISVDDSFELGTGEFLTYFYIQIYIFSYLWISHTYKYALDVFFFHFKIVDKKSVFDIICRPLDDSGIAQLQKKMS